MNVFTKMRKYLLLEALFAFVIGLCLLFAPLTTLTTIIYIIAIFLAVGGVINIVTFIKLRKEYSNTNGFIISGILQLIFALILVRSDIVQIMLPIIIGIVVIMGGCSNISYAMDVKGEQGSAWGIVLFFGIISILAGVLIIMDPFTGASVIMMVSGIVMIGRAIGDIVVYFTMHRIKNEVKTKLNEYK